MAILVSIKSVAQDPEYERWVRADSIVNSLAIDYMKRQLGTKFYEQYIHPVKSNSGIASFLYKNKKCNNEYLIPFLYTNKIIDNYDVAKNVGLDTLKTSITKKDFRQVKKCNYSNRLIMTKDSALAIAFRNFPEIKTTKYSISLHPTWFYSISITLHENEGKWFTVNAITGKVENGFWSSQE